MNEGFAPFSHVLEPPAIPGRFTAKEALFMSLAHSRVEIAAWAEDYDRERPHSSLGYATPAALSANRRRVAIGLTGTANSPRSCLCFAGIF